MSRWRTTLDTESAFWLEQVRDRLRPASPSPRISEITQNIVLRGSRSNVPMGKGFGTRWLCRGMLCAQGDTSAVRRWTVSLWTTQYCLEGFHEVARAADFPKLPGG